MCLMTRPSRDDDRDCVRIDSQALSEDGVVVKVSFKAWRYITKEVLWEVRSVLDDFSEGGGLLGNSSRSEETDGPCERGL